MGVRFTNTSPQYIVFSNPIAALGGLQKTICFKYTPTSNIAGAFLALFDDNDSNDEITGVGISSSFSARLTFLAAWTGGTASWRTTNDVITSTSQFSICFTYNGSSTSNDPLCYINGVSVPLTEIVAPSGSYRVGTDSSLLIGGAVASVDGALEDFRRYSVIKTAAQAALIASENIKTNATIDESNLVFHAPLVMCKELTYSTFVGSTLGASNEFLDRMNGYVGVPTGSPIGA